MSAIQSLLVATDFSERADRAEKRAAMLCAEHKCQTAELLTVRRPEDLETLSRLLDNAPEAARGLVVETVLRELHARSGELSGRYGAGFTCTVEFGQPAAMIDARGEELSADLIVIGAHGGNFFSDLFLGNTANKLIHRSKRALLIVKNEPAAPYRHLLVPVDFSDDSKLAARLALRIAPEAAITFLHAYDVWLEGKMHYAGVSEEAIDYYRLKAHETARLELNRFIADLNAPRHRIRCDLVSGRPGAVIRSYAKDRQPDLIVMGKHGRSRIEEMIIGSVTRNTVDGTPCDIMVVPPLAG